IEIAEEVVEADVALLQSLHDKSLLRRTGDRFWMLETIREYARELLESGGDADLLRTRHADHYLAIADLAYEERHTRGLTWLRQLETENDNFRGALDFLEDRGPIGFLRLAGALGW